MQDQKKGRKEVGNTYKSVISLMDHLRVIYVHHKNKMKLYPKSNVQGRVLEPVVVEDISWLSHGRDA